MEGYTDDALLVLLSNENNAAFVEIYNRYWAALYTAAYKRVKSRELAEEMIQDLFTTLWENRRILAIKVSLRAYLFTAIRNRVLNHFEKEAIRKRYKVNLQAIFSDSDHSMEDAIACNDLSALVEKEIDKLPGKCRQVYELSRKEFISNEEIATRLHISPKTVESHLTKALKILKLQLKDAFTLLFL